MRAPFNTLVTLLDGPGTGTPGFPRAVDVPCRLVPDPYFVDTDFPLASSADYFTISDALPFGPGITEPNPGKFLFDYNLSDRCVFLSNPLVTWIVLRVELCTRPGLGAPYWRASITKDPGPPTECQSHYAPRYELRDLSTGLTFTLLRTSTTTWTDGSYLVTAETTPTGALCISTWTLKVLGIPTADAQYNGTVTVGFEDLITHAITFQLDPLT